MRDTQRNPWPTWPPANERQWREQIEPALRQVYFSQVEGHAGTAQELFAERFARHCQVRHCCHPAPGTDAPAAAVAATLNLAGFGDGGGVIVPNYTYVASACLNMRCTVAFVDIDPGTSTALR